jgi:hypothetical protein
MADNFGPPAAGDAAGGWSPAEVAKYGVPTPGGADRSPPSLSR